MTTCMEPLCDLRESMVEKYITITYRVAGETVREQHWIFSAGDRPSHIVRWDIHTYLPGRGSCQVGDRLRYVGKGRGMVEDVPIGTLATITKDFGFDSRYMFEFDEPTAFHIWSRHPEGEYQGRTGMRTSGYGWEKIG